jgi:hypothetical protein
VLGNSFSMEIKFSWIIFLIKILLECHPLAYSNTMPSSVMHINEAMVLMAPNSFWQGLHFIDTRKNALHFFGAGVCCICVR